MSCFVSVTFLFSSISEFSRYKLLKQFHKKIYFHFLSDCSIIISSPITANTTIETPTQEKQMSDTNDTGTDSTMTEKLKAAAEKASAEKAARRERVVKGSHLLPKLKELVTAVGLTAVENSGFLKVNGGVKGKNVLIAKKGGRVDLSGFSLSEAAVRQVSEQEARDKHLGKVRGQIDFDKSDDEVLASFTAALAELKVAPPAPAPEPEQEAPAADPSAEA